MNLSEDKWKYQRQSAKDIKEAINSYDDTLQVRVRDVTGKKEYPMIKIGRVSNVVYVFFDEEDEIH